MIRSRKGKWRGGVLPLLHGCRKRKKAQQVCTEFPADTEARQWVGSHPQAWKSREVGERSQIFTNFCPFLRFRTSFSHLFPPVNYASQLPSSLLLENKSVHWPKREWCLSVRWGGETRGEHHVEEVKGEVAERKRMRQEIAVWAKIRLLHFLWRKWIRSGRARARCSSHRNMLVSSTFFLFASS